MLEQDDEKLLHAHRGNFSMDRRAHLGVRLIELISTKGRDIGLDASSA